MASVATMGEGGRISFFQIGARRPRQGYNCIPDDSRKLIGESLRAKKDAASAFDRFARCGQRMVYASELMNCYPKKKFGQPSTDSRDPREEQLLRWSLHINSAVDLSPPEVAPLPDIPQSNRSNFQQGTWRCHATGVKGFHYAIVRWKVAWPRIENLKTDFETVRILGIIESRSGRKITFSNSK